MKVLFIGLGSAGQRHLRNLIDIHKGSLQLFALRTKNRKFEIKNNLITSKTDIEKKYKLKLLGNITDIGKIKPKITFICTPSPYHLDYAYEAAKNGSNLFIEKPLSNKLSSAKKFLTFIKHKKIFCVVGYHLKFDKELINLKKKIKSNKYGKVKLIKIDFGENIANMHKYETLSNLIYAQKKLGGGLIFEFSHEIDLTLWLLDKEPYRVINSHSKLSNKSLDVEDYSNTTMIFGNNQSKSLAQINSNLAQNNTERKLTVIFEKSTYIYNLSTGYIYLFDSKGKKIFTKKNKYKRNDLFRDEMKYILYLYKNKLNDKQYLIQSYNTIRVLNKMKIKKNFI